MDIIYYTIYECVDCGQTWTIEEEAKKHKYDHLNINDIR